MYEKRTQGANGKTVFDNPMHLVSGYGKRLGGPNYFPLSTDRVHLNACNYSLTFLLPGIVKLFPLPLNP